jgi:hypothetical protein
MAWYKDSFTFCFCLKRRVKHVHKGRNRKERIEKKRREPKKQRGIERLKKKGKTKKKREEGRKDEANE